MFRLSIVLACATLLLAGPPAAAQEEEEEPETHLITITTFQVPFNDLEEFWDTVDKYVIPSDKENPHVLSERIAGHYYGDSKQTIWFIAEYEDLSAIQKAEEWGEEWFDKNYPEDSAKRDSADTAFEENFLRHFSGHVDNILSVNMNRAK
jgi:hypothetical protein